MFQSSNQFFFYFLKIIFCFLTDESCHFYCCNIREVGSRLSSCPCKIRFVLVLFSSWLCKKLKTRNKQTNKQTRFLVKYQNLMWLRYDSLVMMTWDLFSFVVGPTTGKNHSFNLVPACDTTNQAWNLAFKSEENVWRLLLEEMKK